MLKRQLISKIHHIVHTYVLDVEAVVLRIAESRIHRLNNEVLAAFVAEANKQFHRMTSWEICANRHQNKQTDWPDPVCYTDPHRGV